MEENDQAVPAAESVVEELSDDALAQATGGRGAGTAGLIDWGLIDW